MMDEKKTVSTFLRSRGVIILLFALGILLLLAGSFFTSGKQTKADASLSYSFILEEKIKALCLSVDGINDAHVMLTLADCDYITVSEKNDFYSSEYTYTLIRSDGKKSTASEIHSAVAGIAVVCTDGDDPLVRLKLTELLSAALGIPVSKISICGIKLSP